MAFDEGHNNVKVHFIPLGVDVQEQYNAGDNLWKLSPTGYGFKASNDVFPVLKKIGSSSYSFSKKSAGDTLLEAVSASSFDFKYNPGVADYSYNGKPVYIAEVNGDTGGSTSVFPTIFEGVETVISRRGTIKIPEDDYLPKSMINYVFDAFFDKKDNTIKSYVESGTLLNLPFFYTIEYTVPNDTSVPVVDYDISETESATNFTFKGDRVFCKIIKHVTDPSFVDVFTLMTGVKELVQFNPNYSVNSSNPFIHNNGLCSTEIDLFQDTGRLTGYASTKLFGEWGVWNNIYFYTKVDNTVPANAPKIKYDIATGVEVELPNERNNGKQVYGMLIEGTLSNQNRDILKTFSTGGHTIVSFDGYVSVGNIKVYNTNQNISWIVMQDGLDFVLLTYDTRAHNSPYSIFLRYTK